MEHQDSLCDQCGRPLAALAAGAEQEVVAFEVSDLKRVKAAASPPLERVVHQIDGLALNTLRSVQALKDKLTPDEQARILTTLAQAKDARAEGASLDDLRAVLVDLETSAAIIGRAMFRA